jgi:hypothetical protein
MDTNTTSTDLVTTDADTNEDPSTGSEIAKTLAVGATTTVVVAGIVIAYHRVIKPRVVDFVNRHRANEDTEVIEGTIVETPETEKV